MPTAHELRQQYDVMQYMRLLRELGCEYTKGGVTELQNFVAKYPEVCSSVRRAAAFGPPGFFSWLENLDPESLPAAADEAS